MSKRISFRVMGEVQGVNYRSFTQKKATEYGVTGWVKNVQGGNVEGEAQGTEGAVQKLLQDLNKGPSAAQVDKVEHSDIDAQSNEESFETK